jgi:hypothetical protein
MASRAVLRGFGRLAQPRHLLQASLLAGASAVLMLFSAQAQALTQAGQFTLGSAQFVHRTLVSTSTAPIATTNQKVYVLAYAHGVVYAGGSFSRMHFKGKRYVRHFLGAVNASTGAPTPFRPALNGLVMALALSPDKKVLYVGGQFTAVGSAKRMNIAAFSTVTGKLTSFAPNVSAGSVQAIAATSSGVYMGGTIDRVNGTARRFAAEVTPRGKLLPWAPRLDVRVRAMLISPDKTRIFLGGAFHHSNGVAREALTSVNLTTGANKRFTNGLIPTYKNPQYFSEVTSLSTNGTTIFAGAEGTGPGIFDGTLAFRPDSGKLVWRNVCLGATQDVLYLRGVLYKASHAHYCPAFGDIHDHPGWQPHRLLAENPANGKLLAWGTSRQAVPYPVPSTNAGLDRHLGPYALTSDGRQLFVGGEFTTVNGKAQEGLARFR